jgi:hypothetical protein
LKLVKNMSKTLAALAVLCLAFRATAQPRQAPPQAQKEQEDAKDASAPRLTVFPGRDVAANDKDARSVPRPTALKRFLEVQSDEWEVRWDEKSGRPHLVQGRGIPLLPGAGNDLTNEGLGLAHGRAPEAIDVERLAWAFVQGQSDLLGLRAVTIRSIAESVLSLADGKYWIVEWQQLAGDVPIRDAHVFVRISNGNVVQFGADRVAPVTASTKPAVTRDAAKASLVATLGPERAARLEATGEPTLELVTTDDAGGSAYGHVLVWRLPYRIGEKGNDSEAFIDAKDGTVRRIADRHQEASAGRPGCDARSAYTLALFGDDDDGNLANGTPTGCKIWDGFAAVNAACGTRPLCAAHPKNAPASAPAPRAN